MNDTSTAQFQPFHSILFQQPGESTAPEASAVPEFFHDLNLDQIVAAITSDSPDYDLVPLFHSRLNDLDAIAYRQEIMQDLEDESLMQAVQSFSGKMHAMREHLDQVQKLNYTYEQNRWFLGAVGIYCEAIASLGHDLQQEKVASRGLQSLGDYLAEYVKSASFDKLATDAETVQSALANIKYCLLIKGNSVTVRHYDAEVDYSTAVEKTFEKFRHGAVKNYLASFRNRVGINHIEAQILDRVALLNPHVFQSLETFCIEHSQYQDDKIDRFDREIHFYIAYLTYIKALRQTGLSFCYPQISATSKQVSGQQVFDLALASKLTKEKTAVVYNDFYLHDPERIFIVSGPNQGGKTTFARTFGQLHYLASLGCPVPGTKAHLFLFDQIFTHFDKEEDIANLRGKLQDDLIRIRHILEQATPRSIVIMNEIFSSTTLNDAIFLSRNVLTSISQLDLLGVCVTFLTELASFDAKTVSIVSTVDPDDPALRTYKVERKSADGLAYALAIAEKYRVTYAWLTERIKA